VYKHVNVGYKNFEIYNFEELTPNLRGRDLHPSKNSKKKLIPEVFWI
jgi:hypothetical protein